MKRLWSIFALVFLLAGLIPTVSAQGPAPVPQQTPPPVAVLGVAPAQAEVVLTTHSPRASAPAGTPQAPHPEAVLWDQYANWDSTDYATQDFESVYDSYDIFAADDFENTEPWTIETIVVRGGWGGFVDLNNATALHWWICPDNGGEPLCDPPGDGNEVWSISLPPTDPQIQLGVVEPEDVYLTLNTPINLPAGVWWLAYQVSLEYGLYGQYGWSGTNDPVWGAVGKQNNPGGGFGQPPGWWDNTNARDFMFRLEGTVGQACTWTELVHEDFESWPPPDWNIVNYGGDCVWESNATTGRTNYAGGDGLCADADADWCGSGTTMWTGLWTPQLVDLSNAVSATLRYVASYNYLGGDEYAAVNFSDDGGGSWTNLLTWNTDHHPYGPGEVVTIDLTPYVGSSDSYVEFEYYSPDWNWWFEVDQVVISACVTMVQPLINLTPDTLEVEGCAGEVQTHTLSLYNRIGADDTFTLTYTILTGNGQIVGPSSLFVPNDTTVPFDFNLLPDACLPEGTQIVAEVFAIDSSGTYSDTSVITKTISLGGWVQITDEPENGRMDNVLASYNGLLWSVTGYGDNGNVRTYDAGTDSWNIVGTPAPFGSNYARSGCHPFGSAAENKVFVYGDAATSGFTGLWSYNMDTGVWTNESPGGTPPPYTGIWAPAWVYDPAAQLCYLTGGATTPGGGNLATVFVYDPVNNQWLAPLANFDTPRDFHAAFMYNGMLCVMGGVDAASVVYDSTQCYDFGAGAWNAENADIPALLVGLWGMGYAPMMAPSGLQLWLVNGADAGFQLADNTWYYDDATGMWVEFGPLASGSVYRTAAVNHEGTVYHVGGSSGGFTYVGWADKLQTCPPCAELGFLEGYVYDLDAGGVPCTGAVVHIEPGNLDVPVDPTGYYWTALFSGTYDIAATAPGYSVDGPHTVTVTSNMTTTWDFGLVRPYIAVEPTDFVSVTIPVGGWVTYTMVISNMGGLPLDYEIVEIPPTMLETIIVGPATTGLDALIEEELATSADGKADVFVAFDGVVDLTPATAMHWNTRGEWVYSTLKARADRAQANVRAWLEARGIEYRSFIVDNTIFARLSADEIAELSAFSEVVGFRGNHLAHIDVIAAEETPANNAPTALAWGIDLVDADLVWSDFGVRGQGIKVANIDTGVEWDHDALVDTFACPGDPSNPACWEDPSNVCGGSACDNNGHGTHTMGTMTASDDPTLTWQAGMAPDSTWIACKGCESSSCSDFALNTCADWILAPDSDPANRPHVVNNSWGGGPACDTWYLAKVQAWRAAGVFPAFSNGNAGPSCSTAGAPGNYDESFASGATASNDAIASFSSRGPSNCGGIQKPDVSAPGVSVCSTVPGNGWSCAYSGTSMASPHTAGEVALIWSANPGWIGNIAATEQLVMDTALCIDDPNCGGGPCPDGNNIYGDGRIYAYDAVAAVAQPMDIPWVREDPVTGTVPVYDVWPVDVSFICTDTGELTGTLQVRHNDPCQPDIDIPLAIHCIECEPIQIVTVTTEISGCVVTFTADITGTEPYTYDWDFGAFGSSTSPTPTVNFFNSGTYPYTLTTANACGDDVITGTVTVTCAGCDPVGGADFTWFPFTPAISEVVTFNGSVMTGTPPITYDWAFGDGTFGSGQSVTHTYGVTGTYVVVMTATNDCGQEVVTDTLTVVLTPTCTPVEIITVTTAISGCVVDFAPDYTGDPPFTFLWEFGDGMTSTLEMPTYDYGASGTYAVTFHAWNCDGEGHAMLSFPVTVSCEAPTYEIYLPLVFKNYGP